MKAKKLLNKVLTPNHMYSYCRIIGCGRPASAGTDSGLNRLYCRKHQEHYARHGSYTKRSYSRREIEQYRRTALKWLMANKSESYVVRAIKGIEGLYRSAGPRVEAFRLNGLTPLKRAKAAWARLREAGIDPLKPLAAWLAVELIILDDPQPDLSRQFRWVQAAKIVHRMASGSHKRWEVIGNDGKLKYVEMHKYPRSRGRVLVHIGRQLEKVAELVVTYHLESIRTVQAENRHP